MAGTILVKGFPGVGKTTLVSRVVERVKLRGYTVGGMMTREIRSGKVRVGFEILDLYTGAVGILAHIMVKDGPRVGKYGVDITGLEAVGVKAITESLERPEVDLLVVDEIGSMELTSSAFKSAVRLAVSSGKPFLGTVQLKLFGGILEMLGSGRAFRVVELTYENRERQVEEVAKEVLKMLGERPEADQVRYRGKED
ncbi:MAG: NTPase [Candidatus Bathyarchaeia archaeon]